MKHEILRIEDVHAREHGIKILDNFFMHLFKGELLGVFANNATDKKHFRDLICGHMQLDRGRICYGNKPVEFSNYHQVYSQKIALIQPKSKLVEDLTVASNIFVVRDGFKQQLIHEDILENQASQLMKELGIDLLADSYVHLLTRYEKTLIEIVKAYGRSAEIIVFEDLSRYLTDFEIRKMYPMLHRLKELGTSIILLDSYASVFEDIADRVMIMEKGRNAWSFDKTELMEKELHHFLRIHSSETTIGSNVQIHETQSPVLQFSNVSCDGLPKINFDLYEGQLISVIDREGAGVDAIGRILKGEVTKINGSVMINGKQMRTRNPWQSVKRRMGFISENPSESMLFDNLSAIDNLTYAAMNKLGHTWFRKSYNRSVIEEYKDFFSPGALLQYTSQLSTFDRHRLAYLKWHLYNPKVVVCFKPFSSVDMALRETTLELMRELMAKGISILILTSNFQAIKSLGNYIELNSED